MGEIHRRKAQGEESMLTKRFLLAGAAILGFAIGAGQVRAAEEVEMIHWWTSGGEAGALNVLRQDLETEGVGWKDAAGRRRRWRPGRETVLQARMTAGDPPTAIQMLGLEIPDWAKEGALGEPRRRWPRRAGGTQWCRRRCRRSTSTTGIGSRRPSTCTRPTGSGRTRRCSTRSARPSPRPGRVGRSWPRR